MSAKILKGILIQDGTPTPDNPVEIKNLIVNEEAEKYIEDLQQKVEQLESIRKEAIEYIKTHWSIDNPTLFKNDVWDILNKGSKDNERN